MKSAEVIRGVLDLLDSPEKWIKNTIARTRNGTSTAALSPVAASWCLGGAIMKVTNCDSWYEASPSTYRLLDQRADDEYGFVDFVEFNNDKNTTYEDMRLFLKRALIEAEEKN